MTAKIKRKTSATFLSKSETGRVMKYILSLMKTRRISMNLISKEKRKLYTACKIDDWEDKIYLKFMSHTVNQVIALKTGQYPLFLSRKMNFKSITEL